MSKQKTPSTAERVPQVGLATLSQLKELVAMMDVNHPKLTQLYMQDFLRFRLVKPANLPPTLDPVPENKLWTTVEALAQQYYPHVVNEILEVVSPFCDPNLDLEFKHPGRHGRGSEIPKEDLRDLRDQVSDALFWENSHRGQEMELLRLSKKPDFPKSSNDIHRNGSDEKLREFAFTDARKIRHGVNSKWKIGAEAIAKVIGDEVHKKIWATKANHYGLLWTPGGYPFGFHQIEYGIRKAVELAVAFLGVEDYERAKAFTPFLEFQRSGTPIIWYTDEKIYVLCA